MSYMSWTSLVKEIVEDLPAEFTLEQVSKHEKDLQTYYPKNNNVVPKIRQQLQVLRDMNMIVFLNEDGSVADDKYQGSGRYRKVGVVAPVIKADDEDEEKIVRWGAEIAFQLTDRQRALFLMGFTIEMSS